MKTLISSTWFLKPDIEEISNKTIDFLNKKSVLYNSTHYGTYKIEGRKLHVYFPDCEFEGYWGDECIFGYILKNDKQDKFRCEYECKSYISDCGEKLIYEIPGEDNEVQCLIYKIYQLIKDYRIEFEDDSRITKSRIQDWINQFPEEDKVIILKELINIFSKRYLSTDDVLKYWDDILTKMYEKYNFSDIYSFLLNCHFIRTQHQGKSQDILLKTLASFIQNNYGIPIEKCGSSSKKYSIYVDDVLCTGLTLKNDMTKWAKEDFSLGKTNYEAVADGSTNLICCYIFAHKKNYKKKICEMKYHELEKIAESMDTWAIWIDNSIGDTSKLEILIPIKDSSNKKIIAYENEIKDKVQDYLKEKGYGDTKEEFYRNNNVPEIETFFTSSVNRNKVETIFLEKGISILEHTNVNNDRMRALGYSIPSHKNFGFGALCFTWRSIPNNTPLVFWYNGGGFIPLFDVRKGSEFIQSNIILNII